MTEPVFKERIGNVTAAVWENTVKVNGQDIKNHSVTVEKSYKDKEGNWKNTTSLNRNEVPKAIEALRAAYLFMFDTNEED